MSGRHAGAVVRGACLGLLAALLVYGEVYAQNEGYTLPLRPAKQYVLTGAYGELRADHFHAGIDLKTDGRAGLPVYAVRKGYVSRIKTFPRGYGHVLYVRHEDDKTSVYAHLQDFHADIIRWVRARQYASRRYGLDLRPAPYELPVAEGALIGLSGNTGFSTGPHLHFELRNKAGYAIDPLRYGFHRLRDRAPPRVVRIAFRTMNEHARVAGHFGRIERAVLRRGGVYTLAAPVHAEGLIGIEVLVKDPLLGGKQSSGVPRGELFVNRRQVFSWNIAEINFTMQGHLNRHMDYAHFQRAEAKFNKLYVDTGNALDFYESDNEQGLVYMRRGQRYTLQLRLWDGSHNESVFRTTLNAGRVPVRVAADVSVAESDRVRIFGDVLRITVPRRLHPAEALSLYLPTHQTVLPAYATPTHQVYLWNMRQGIPWHTVFGEQTYVFDIQGMVPPGEAYTFSHDRATVAFARGSLFDTLYFRFAYSIDAHGKERFQFRNTAVPLRKRVRVGLRPMVYYPTYKTSVYRVAETLVHLDTEWQGYEAQVRTDVWGDFILAVDTVPPTIALLEAHENELVLWVRDTLSGLGLWEASLNGEWILMHYEPKTHTMRTRPRDPTTNLRGKFEIMVYDKQENVSLWNINL